MGRQRTEHSSRNRATPRRRRGCDARPSPRCAPFSRRSTPQWGPDQHTDTPGALVGSAEEGNEAMEKLVYALWGVHEGLVEKAGPELLALDPCGLTVNVVDSDIDMSAIVSAHDGERVGATVGLWLDSL